MVGKLRSAVWVLCVLLLLAPNCNGGATVLVTTLPLGEGGLLVSARVNVDSGAVVLGDPAEPDGSSPVEPDPDGLLLAIGADPAALGHLLVIDGNAAPPLLLVDPIELGGPVPGVPGLSFAGVVSGIYKNRRQISLRPLTAQVTEIGPFGLPEEAPPEPPDEILLLANLTGAAGTIFPALLTIDPGSGAVSLVGELMIDSGSGPAPIGPAPPSDLNAVHCEEAALMASVIVDGVSILLSIDLASAVGVPIEETFEETLLASPLAPAGALAAGPNAAALVGCTNVIVGTSGNDVLIGTNADDCIDGLAGKDKLEGRDGNDELSGGPGKDKLRGGNGDDIIDGGDDDDSAKGGDGDDTISGGPGKDKLKGEKGNDTLSGGPGKDKLDGKDGNDILDGGDDDDSAKGGDGDDTIFGGGGNDKLKGDKGNDFLDGGPGEDKLKAGDGDDFLAGGPGDDELDGGKDFDCAIFDGDLADFVFDDGDSDSALFATDTVGPGGTDRLKNIECFEFDDQTVIPGPNDAPIDILLTNDEVDDGDPVGTLVGNFIVIDPDLVDGHVLTLVPGAGDTDNASFTIVGDMLLTSFVADFATQSSYSIRVQAEDLEGETFEKVFTITVNPPQQAFDDLATVAEDDPATAINVLGNDINMFPAPISAVTQPANGTVVITGGLPGTGLTYEPDPDYCNDGTPTDDFTYTLTPSGSVATVAVTVTCVNDAPTADADTATTLEDNAVVISLTGSDPDGDPLTFVPGPDPAGGTLSGLTPTGPTSADLTYTPDPDFCNNGAPTDDFTFTVFDGSASSPPATVAVTVTCVNDAPTADADTAATLEDNAVVISLTGSDPDGDPLTFVPGPDPAGGTLSGLTPTGPTSADLTYTPDPDFCNNGAPTDDFTFTVFDGSASSPPATVAVTVTCVNDAPTADADTAATLEDNAVVISLTGSDPDGDPLTFVPGPDPAGGTLSGLTPTGPTSADLTYTPDPDFCNNGAPTDDFTFTVFDGSASSPPATVAVTVTCVNDAPTADADTAATLEDNAVVISLTGSDPDGDPLTFVPGPDPAGGTLSGLTPTGPTSADLTYTPDPDFCNNGAPTDDFTFTVFDGSASSPPATVAVTVTCVNDAPTADADTATTLEDNAVVISLTGSDPDGDPLSFVPGPDPAGGTLSGLTPTGPTSADLTYTPDPDFCNNGAPTDDFTFTVFDGSASSPPATVAVTVTCVNDAPTADADTATTLEDNAVVISLTGSDPDGDPLSFVPGPDPAGGTLSGLTPTGPTSADLTYTPDPDFCNNGAPTDDFTFTVFDGSVTSPPATVAVTVTCVNDAPTADADTAATLEDNAVVISLTGSDPDGDPLSFVPGPDPAGGTLSGLTPTGPTSADLTYTPDPDFCNNGAPTDDFTFTVFDGSASSPPATVAVTVTCVNDAPTADADTATTLEDNAVVISLTGSDPDGDPLSFVPGPDPAGGTLSGLTPTGPTSADLTYTPDPDFCNNGTPTDDFTFTVFDGSASSPPATVAVTVTCVNDPPTAAAGPYTARSNIQIDVPAASGLLAASFDDPSEGTALTVDGPAVKATTAGGTVTITLADGAFSYNPPPGHVGPDDFSFTVTDSGIPLPGETSAPATVSITVSGPVVWFIDDSAAPGGDGTLAKPFGCVVGGGCFSPVAAAGLYPPSAGDTIFVAEGTGAGYASTGPLALLPSEQLIGEGASTALPTLVPGLTPLPPFSLTLPTTGGTPPTLTSSADIVDVVTGNTIRGVDLADNGGFAIDGSGFGTLSVGGTSPSDVTIDAAASGGGVRLTTGTPSVLLASLTSAFGASGIDLASVGGTFEVEGATTITDSTAAAVEVDASSVAVTLGLTTITDAGGNGIDLDGLTGSFTLTSPGGGITFPTGTNDSHGVLIQDSDNVIIQGTATSCDPFGGATATCFAISDAGNGAGSSSLTSDAEGFQGVAHIDSGDLTVRFTRISGIGGQSSLGGVEHAVFVFDPDAGSTLTITDNDIFDIKNDGVDLGHENLTGTITVDVSRNDIDGSGATGGVETTDFGIDIDIDDGSTSGRLLATIGDNTIDDVNSIGIGLVLAGDTGGGGLVSGSAGSENEVTMANNTIRDFDFDGISILPLGNSRNLIEITNVTIDGVDTPVGATDPDRGIEVLMDAIVEFGVNTSVTDLTITGGDIRDVGDEGIQFRNFGDFGSSSDNQGQLTALIQGAITVTNNGDQGLRAEPGQDGLMNLRVVSGDFSGNDVGAGTPEDILVGVRSGGHAMNSYLADFATSNEIRIETDGDFATTHQFACKASCPVTLGTSIDASTLPSPEDSLASILNHNGVTNGGAVVAADIDFNDGSPNGDIDVVDQSVIPTATAP